ncbi:hypothetical protein TNCV_490331 [Trichonephila clavipes]|nr:hypothetical protein TNCV_490331 [Trichonephila clavipes]
MIEKDDSIRMKILLVEGPISESDGWGSEQLIHFGSRLQSVETSPADAHLEQVSCPRHHNVSSCKFTTSCRACKQRHHTVLHQFQSSPRKISVSNSNQNLAATSDQNVVQPLATSQKQFCLAGQMNYSNSILLSTAIVRVKNSQEQYVNCQGWLLSGKVSTACQSQKKVMSLINFHKLLDLQNQIAEFWEVESIPDARVTSEKKIKKSKNSTSATQEEIVMVDML